MDQVKTQAQEQAGELAGRAKGVIIGQIDQRSTEFGDTIVTHATNMRQLSDSLRTQGQDSTAKLADTAADRLEQLGYYLTETDGERIVADAERLARRQPLLTLGVGLLAGVIAARLLKASATERYQYYSARPTGDAFNQSSYQNSYGRNAAYYED
ncbi:MAG: hypothetical protein GIW97_01910 [Candidatus Eremiobacteraeota bacterium]|nr:hypothetical protein [Candidatus Eremiobacteraeota bacterium]